MYFLTSVTLPIDSTHCKELRFGAAFDRETGERLEVWELFSCDEQEAKRAIFDAAGITEPVLRAEMEAVFNPERIQFLPDCLLIDFPVGELPSQEYTYIISAGYEDGLDKLMYDWAIPDSCE